MKRFFCSSRIFSGSPPSSGRKTAISRTILFILKLSSDRFRSRLRRIILEKRSIARNQERLLANIFFVVLEAKKLNLKSVYILNHKCLKRGRQRVKSVESLTAPCHCWNRGPSPNFEKINTNFPSDLQRWSDKRLTLIVCVRRLSDLRCRRTL